MRRELDSRDAEEQSAFKAPQLPQEEWVARLYSKHGLGESPSLEQIEPVATKLLGDVLTALDGAELVLGRRVSTSEKELSEIIYFGGSGADKFGLLLMEREIDAAKKRKQEQQ